MTNEQLAVLLSSHHSRLADIFNRLCDDLKDIEGLEYHKEKGEWIGKGEKPGVFDFGERHRNPDNWTWNDKNPVCLDALSIFTDDLEQSVKDLLGERE